MYRGKLSDSNSVLKEILEHMYFIFNYIRIKKICLYHNYIPIKLLSSTNAKKVSTSTIYNVSIINDISNIKDIKS